MKIASALPAHYAPLDSVDLQKNKRLALLVNGLAFLIAVAMALPVAFFVPITALFDMESGYLPFFLRLGALALGSLAYIILHELTHGVAMRLCGTKRVKYGFTGLYAFAGSDDYYGKGAYLFIALAPVVLFGVLLAVLAPIVPTSWFWVVYLIQISNISGAAGDFYVTVRFLRLPKEILVKDEGTSMTVYAPTPAE